MVSANHSAAAVPEGAVWCTVQSARRHAVRSIPAIGSHQQDNPEDYIAGFPSHPHRGFITFTYMIDGHMAHQDSMGNSGDLGPGSAQWMKAASGVIHSEMPKQENGLLRGFQLWLNMPAANKLDYPE